MNSLKEFDEYLEDGTAKKQSPDINRAMSLVAESENSYKILVSFIAKTGIDDSNANHIIKNAYDVIMELVRARMLLDGFGTTGKGAHEAEVAYMSKIGFSENDVSFANNLRWFRNGIMYYGKKFDKAYANNVMDFLKIVLPMLRKMLV